MIKEIFFYATFLIFFYNEAIAATVTSVTVYEKAGVTTNNYPLTFALPFKKGDVTTGIIVKHEGTALATQFDIKRTWADGSVKHGIISIVIPRVDANTSEVLTIETGSTNSSIGSMDKPAILATDAQSTMSMTNMSGSGNPASASVSLRTAINDGELNYWMQGPVCTEILEDMPITPNGNLHARWEARFYPGTAFGIRISNIVEQTNLSALGTTMYDVAIQQGNSSPQTVYSFNGHSHSYGSRWRKTYWLGAEPPKTELHYDTDYLISTGMVMPLDTSLSISQSSIDSLDNIFKNKQSISGTYPLGQRGGNDIDGAGNIYRPMPQVGGRDEIGLLPTWSTMYLLNYSDKLRAIVLGNGDIAGQVGSSHYREGDSGMSFYMEPIVSIDSRPTVQLWYPSQIPAAVGDITNNPNQWNPDRAHQPSLAYIPYLLTGEHYYMEEIMFWASFNIGYTSYGRDGVGKSQNFSSNFPEGKSAGIIHDEIRAVAWAMRNISDAVNIVPNSKSTAITYFKTKLNNNLQWLYLGNAESSHGLHALRVPREDEFSLNPNYKIMTAPWMHDFNVITMSDMIRKEESVNDIQSLITLRDRIGAFTVGRFTNHPDFNKWNGCGYWWPLRKPDGNYFTSGSWGEYWNAIVVNNVEDTAHAQAGLPHSDYSRYAIDPESYLYIAKAALSQLTHLSGGEEAYSFVSGSTNSSLIPNKPQWGGLVPAGISPPAVHTKTHYRLGAAPIIMHDD